jgi:hypothetical protein
MSLSRAGETLGERIQPRNWLITFRPPRWPDGGWEFGATLFGQAYRFHTPTEDGGFATLAVFRIEDRTADAAAICDRILRHDLGVNPKPVGWNRFTRLDTRMGPFHAVQMFDPIVTRVVRAAEFGGAGVYAASLKASGPEIDPGLYEAFDRTCESIEVRTR